MLRPSPNHGTQRLPNDDYDDNYFGLRFLRYLALFIMIININNKLIFYITQFSYELKELHVKWK